MHSRLQVRNRLTGEVLVLKVIQFDVSSDVIRKQVSQWDGRGPGVVHAWVRLIDGTAPAQTPACMHGVCSSRVRPFKCGKYTRQVTTELRTLHGASHPHVVKYHQAFFDNGAITIVMEHMDGGSLADVLKLHNGLKEPYIAELARQVRLLRWSRSRRLGLLKQTAFALRRPGVMN